MEEVADHLGQHPESAEHADERRLPPQLQQVDIEQGLPRSVPVGLDRRGHGIGDVIERQEGVGEPGFRHPSSLRAVRARETVRPRARLLS
jgi:hypothetical protein